MRNDTIVHQIERLLRAGELPSRVSQQAQRVLTALTKPKRITVMGPPKSGKYDMLALLAGTRVVGSDVALGTIRLMYGDTPLTTVKMADGTTQDMPGVPTLSSLEPGMVPVETTIQAPLPALRKITLMRLAEANDIDSQVKAMHEAAKQSDIVIWCTSKFGAVEQRMWVQMPEHVRDNAFVLRTNLDGFGRDVAAARSDLGKRAGDEFAFVLATDLRKALSAQVSVPVDTAAMKASGANVLITTLLKEIDQGRENATDQADLILAKYPAPAPTAEDEAVAQALVQAQEDAKAVAEASASTAPAPVNEAPSQPDQDASPVAEAISDLASDMGAKHKAPPRPVAKPKRKDPGIFPMFELDNTPDATAAPEPAPVPVAEPITDSPAAPALSETAIVLCNDLIARLSSVGTQDSDPSDYRSMFNAGLETLEWMDGEIADVANDDKPVFARLQGMTEEATDLIHLLRLENTDTAALDAATILLQMKRSVHAVLAA